MFGKLFDLIARRPDLILNHALAYVDLVQQEFSQTRGRLLRQIVAALVALALAITLLVVIGVAALLALANVIVLTPAVFAVPGIALAGVILASGYAVRVGVVDKPVDLRAQIGDDIRLLRDMAESRS
jgi:hypothetical protein